MIPPYLIGWLGEWLSGWHESHVLCLLQGELGGWSTTTTTTTAALCGDETHLLSSQTADAAAALTADDYLGHRLEVER